MNKCFFGIVAVISCIILIFNLCITFNDHTYEFKVTGKERITKSDDSYYLIYGFDEYGDSKVFTNTDRLLRCKFDSSNMYAEIEEDKYYKVTVIGVRIPICDMYENIIDYTEIEGWESEY